MTAAMHECDRRVKDLLDMLLSAMLALEQPSPGLVQALLRRLDAIGGETDDTAKMILLRTLEYRAEAAHAAGQQDLAISLLERAMGLLSPQDETYYLEAAGIITARFLQGQQQTAFTLIRAFVDTAVRAGQPEGTVNDILRLASFADLAHSAAIQEMPPALTQYENAYLGARSLSLSSRWTADPAKVLDLLERLRFDGAPPDD